MSKSVLGSIRRASRRVQSGGRGLRIVVFAWLLALLTCAGALAQGAYPVFGIHFWSPSASYGPIQIQNGKPMWTVEMLYTQEVKNWDANKWSEETRRLQEIYLRGFRIILRIDYAYYATVPYNNDWNAKQDFVYWTFRIATQFSPFLHAIIIGNELKEYPGSPISPEWYARIFNSPDDTDFWTVYRLVKNSCPHILLGIYAPGGWPGSGDISFWEKVVHNVRKDANGKPQIDCFPLHAYSGASTVSDIRAENPRYGDECDWKGFVPYIRRIYSIFGPSKPVYITETNTQWFFGKWDTFLNYSALSYRQGWLKEAFTAVRTWNMANDIKICALCWYVWHAQCTDVDYCDQWQNSLERTDDRSLMLPTARQDYYDITLGNSISYAPGNPGGPIRFQFEEYTNSDTREGRGWTNGINFLDYSSGIPGVDYYDTTRGNRENYFRWDDVDIRRDDGYGYAVNWTDPGEWLMYRGLFGGQTYRLRVRFARPLAGSSRVRVSVDGVQRAEITLDDPDDSGATWHIAEGTQNIFIRAGDHRIRVDLVDGRLWLDWFELVPVTGGPQ